MKTTSKLSLLTLVLFACITSCNTDSDSLPILDEVIGEEPIEEETLKGTVLLQPFVKEVIDVQTGKAPPTLDEVLDDLSVEIFDLSGNTILQTQYRSLPNSIELPVQGYAIYFYTSVNSNNRFDNPSYGTQEVIFFNVLEGNNTTVNVALSLFDVAASIDFTDEVLQAYPNLMAKVDIDTGFDIGTTPLQWSSSNNLEIGYFNLLEYVGGAGGGLLGFGTTDLIVEITALDSANNEILVTKTYPDVATNQHYRITVSYTGASTASLNITLGDEEVIEDTINFPN